VQDLADRYTQLFRMAWRVRRELDSPRRLAHENEFLPAALALRDTPLHPAPRIAMATIMGLLAVAVVWASVGKVDVVATAHGKIVPNGDVKVIQSQDTAVITAIHVTDGQHVRQGQPLIDLDATDAATTAAHTQADLTAARVEAMRAHAMLQAMDQRRLPALGSESGLDTGTLAEQNHVLGSEYADFASNLQALNADIAQGVANLHQTEAEIHKLAQTLPIEQTKENDYAKLVVPGYVGLHDYYNEQQAVIQMQQDLTEQRAKQVQMQAALDSATRKRDAYVAQTRRQWLEKLTDDQTKGTGLQQDLARAQQHGRLMHLVAPVDGTVQQLAVHTLGGVVTAAQNLMTVVPASSTLIVEADVDNQDIGFVHEGQAAEVKVESFPFTRYGTLHGTVLQVSNDAKQDDAKQWVFPASVALNTATIQIEGRAIPLVPGMTVTMEIKTARRRILSYLLSPLIQHAQESMHER
jgi:hemolysin D